MGPRAVALSLVLALAPGCSWLFVKKLPDPPPAGPAECSGTRVYPVLDYVGAALAAINGIGFLLGGCPGDCASSDTAYRIAGAGLTVGAGALTLSGLAGWRGTGRCAEHQKKTSSTPPEWEPF